MSAAERLSARIVVTNSNFHGSVAEICQVLAHGDITLTEKLPVGQNQVFSATVVLDGVELACVYKPVAGERPLWDFPEGTLAGREVAAWHISEATGWNIVPPTVLRGGPFGSGSCQLWIDAQEDPSLVEVFAADAVPSDWLPVLAGLDADGQQIVVAHANNEQLAQVALFDAVINNGDRKAGHLLITKNGQIKGIDHGITFHRDPKLRTVLWGWAGQALAPHHAAMLDSLAEGLAGSLTTTLRAHITHGELIALRERIAGLLGSGVFPLPGTGWPAVPYPLW